MKIELRELTVTRPGGIRALDAVSLVFDSAQSPAWAVLGANGAGKSTLLESILGLHPGFTGSVTVDGIELNPKTFSAIRRKVGMVFQNPEDQLFSQTVREDVSFGPENLGWPEDEVRRRVDSALTEMKILSLADRDLTHLSGGEKRRAAIAGVLAMQPDAIFFDEPTSMLDPRGSRELAEHLTALTALKIVATHDLAFAARVCPECVILKDGAIFRAGRTADLLAQSEVLAECGLA